MRGALRIIGGVGMVAMILGFVFVPSARANATDAPELVPLVALGSANADANAVVLPNPLGAGRSDISSIIGGVLRAAFGLLGALALCMFLYGGFLWLISGGNADKIKKGQETMIWAALGIATIFAAYAITGYVIAAITGQ